MQLVILSRTDLTIKDYGYFGSDYEIVLDAVVYQKSKFIINKEYLNAEVGDIVFTRGLPFSYIGIIDAITKEDEDLKITLEVSDFSSIFDIQVTVSSYSGDLCEFLRQLIYKTFVSNTDKYQALPYLNLTKSCAINGSLTYEGTQLVSITEVSEMLAKRYGIRYKCSLKVSNEGVIEGINVEITNVTKGMKIRHDLKCIKDLEIVDSNKQGCNKIIFYPKDDNTSYKSTVIYYLLTDGSISTSSTHSKRIKNVKCMSQFYSDNEYSSLYTKASSELLKSNLEHNIEFKISVDNLILVPFDNINVGDFLEFVTESKTYSTMVTQLSVKGNLYECSVVLGEYRIKLTDKIKLLEKK